MGVNEAQNLPPLLPDHLGYILEGRGVFIKESHSQGRCRAGGRAVSSFFGHQGRGLAIFPL